MSAQELQIKPIHRWPCNPLRNDPTRRKSRANPSIQYLQTVNYFWHIDNSLAKRSDYCLFDFPPCMQVVRNMCKTRLVNQATLWTWMTCKQLTIEVENKIGSMQYLCLYASADVHYAFYSHSKKKTAKVMGNDISCLQSCTVATVFLHAHVYL
jgi:hypothetical protein